MGPGTSGLIAMTTSTKTKPKKLIIIDPERQALAKVSKPAHFVVKVNFKLVADSDGNSFLIVPVETLTKHLPSILKSFESLRIVFVLDRRKHVQKVDALLDKIVQNKAQRILPKLLVAEKFEDIDRILHAWCDGVQNSSIAEAWVDVNNLVIKTCALERLSIAFAQLPWLAKIPDQERGDFEIDPLGSHIYWQKQDVHLNVDAVRCAIDEDFQTKRDIMLLMKNKAYGHAIAAFREQSGLSQQEVMRQTGITDRQLRRIEREGHSLSLQMAESLAAAHGMTANEYLKTIAESLQH
jgi:DNA-binding XRE family transcriptional regulator